MRAAIEERCSGVSETESEEKRMCNTSRSDIVVGGI